MNNWEKALAYWIKTQFGTAGDQVKLERFVEKLILQARIDQRIKDCEVIMKLIEGTTKLSTIDTLEKAQKAILAQSL